MNGLADVPAIGWLAVDGQWEMIEMIGGGCLSFFIGLFSWELSSGVLHCGSSVLCLV